ncbi:hypothetical protein [Kiloniella sp.]|uniref:hypothetical protein n=1 Tax=Kiloniella sp. TaxID=1938587 RepID=UPI003B01668F
MEGKLGSGKPHVNKDDKSEGIIDVLTGMFAACSFSIAITEDPFYKKEEIQSFCDETRDPKPKENGHGSPHTKTS